MNNTLRLRTDETLKKKRSVNLGDTAIETTQNERANKGLEDREQHNSELWDNCEQLISV